MNHMPRRKPISEGNFGVAGRAAIQGTAFGEKPWSRGAMDCTVDATAAEQGGIRRVHDRVNAERRDVGDDCFQPRRSDQARTPAQAEAAALTVTPLSASSCCSSPAWNISRMISQPPTNSPFT